MADLAVHPHLRRIEVDTPNGKVSYAAPAAIFVGRAAALRRRARHRRPRRTAQSSPRQEPSVMTASRRKTRPRSSAAMDRPHHGSHRHRHRATGEGPARDAVPGDRRAEDRRRRAMDHALVPGAAGVSDVEARARTATRPAAASCRRCRCRAGCGPAARLEFFEPLRVGDEVEAHLADFGRDDEDRLAPARCASSPSSTPSRRRAAPRSASGRTSSIATWRPRPPAAPAKAPPPPPVAKHRESHIGRSRAAVSLFGADLQRPPHPLRPRLRHQGRGLSGPGLPRPAAGGVHRRVRGQSCTAACRRRNSAIAACSRCSKAANSRSTPTTTSTGMELWTANAEGQPTMKGTATW